MHYKTQAIVLSISKYSDAFSIAHVFTRDFGKVSYLLPRRSGRRSKVNGALFFPLSLLNLEVEHLPLREIQRLKEAGRERLLYAIGSDMTKASLAFFLSEFLLKVLRETVDNRPLFDYLKNSVEVLEAAGPGLANFHLAFIVGLSRFLGIYPNLGNYAAGCRFDMLNGEFVSGDASLRYCLTPSESAYLHLLSRIRFSNMHLFRMSRADRNRILDRLLTYYRLHLYDFAEIKSLEILRELF